MFVKDMKGILGWFLRKTLKKESIEKQISEYDKLVSTNIKPNFYQVCRMK